jgi:hypothetical protein
MLTSLARRSVATNVVGRRCMSAITGVKGREIIDSRGNPTVEVSTITACGARAYLLPAVSITLTKWLIFITFLSSYSVG